MYNNIYSEKRTIKNTRQKPEQISTVQPISVQVNQQSSPQPEYQPQQEYQYQPEYQPQQEYQYQPVYQPQQEYQYQQGIPPQQGYQIQQGIPPLQEYQVQQGYAQPVVVSQNPVILVNQATPTLIIPTPTIIFGRSPISVISHDVN